MGQHKPLTFLVVENAADVCEGIIRRMGRFPQWQSLGYCVHVAEAVQRIAEERPSLLFLDWGLNGGSAFEVLRAVQNMADYNPYIVFNTGFQKDNPEIPQEIINHYKVDKYLVKPIWENLQLHLADYVREAEAKARVAPHKSEFWVERSGGGSTLVDATKIICVCQHPTEPRLRRFYLNNHVTELDVSLQWQRCYDLLQSAGVDFFVTKSRGHLVVRDHIVDYQKPFVWLRGLSFKVDVVKESVREFEAWLFGDRKEA